MHDRELRALIGDEPVPGVSEKFYVCKAGANPYEYWTGKVASARLAPTIADGYARLNGGQNEVLFLSPDSHALTETLTWAHNHTHFVGMSPAGMMNHRSRFSASGSALVSLMEVTGYGNYFANLHSMWEYNDSDCVNGVKITGNRNTFDHVHFAGPNSTGIDTALSAACNIYGAEECHFKHCTFGSDSIQRQADLLSLKFDGAGGSDVAMRHIFEDCLFLASSDAGLDAHFIHATTATHGWALFKRCTFINIATGGFGDNTMALALSSANGADFRMVFDTGCSFHGVTDIIAHGEETKVEFGVAGDPAAAVGIGLFINPDTTA